VTPADSSLFTGEIKVTETVESPVSQPELVIRAKEFEKIAMTREEAVDHIRARIAADNQGVTFGIIY